jgi:hypothetical protein
MTPAKFTRENPCTKVHIWRAFRRAGQYPDIPVVEARSIIGIPASKYLVTKGYALTKHLKGVDLYRLTTDGIKWLEAGLRRHLELHPEQRAELHEPLAAERPVATFKKKAVAVAVTATPPSPVRRRTVR